MRDRMLKWIGELAWRHPILIIALALALAGVSVLYANRTIKLNANTDDLISPDLPYMQKYRAFLDEFGDLEFMYVVVESPPQGQANRAEEIVDALDARLRQIPGLPAIFSSIEPAEQLRIATRARKSIEDPTPAMSDAELDDLASVADGIATLMSANDAAVVLSRANGMLEQLIREGRQMPQEQQERIGANAIFLLSAIAAVDDHSKSGVELRSQMPSSLKREYFTSPSGKFYFIMIMPAKDYSTLSVIHKPLERIRDAIRQVQAEFPGVNIGLTGKPVLQADEMSTSNNDMTKASVLAFVLCAVLFFVMIGGILRPGLAMIAFLIGSAWTYGAAALLVGQLNLLSIVFMLVLIGVAFDYGVHVISRYKESRAHQSVHDSIVSAVITAVRGNLTGALTSSTVFFMALLTSFEGLRELGVIAGAGLLLCLISISLVLPALLALIDGRRENADRPAPSDVTVELSPSDAGMLGVVINRPSVLLAIAAAFTLALSLFASGLRFEFNLLQLQARGLESVEWEHRILEDAASASWFGAAIADSPEQALAMIGRAQQKPAIGVVHSVFDVVSPQRIVQPAARERLQEVFKRAKERTADRPGAQPPLSEGWSAGDLRKAIESLNLMAFGAARQSEEQARPLRQLSSELATLAHQFDRNPLPNETRSLVDETVREIAQGFRHIIEGDQLPLRDALPEGIGRQYMSPEGRFLIAMHPQQNVWEYEPMREFIAQMREVDSNITGAPITHFESLGDMQRSFIIMSILALAVIIVIVWLDFRNWRDVLLALAPLVMSLAWTVGLMDVFNIAFNLANFFSVPILIGLGVDASVHVLHRYHEGGPTRFSLGATRRAVILTALTTIIGFGCLVIAQHRGLRSLGLVMAIGSMCGMVASVVVLPALLVWLEPRRKRVQHIEALKTQG